MTQPMIAALIATKNREHELANRALASLLAQTRKPDLLVVVDDSHPRHREANQRIARAVAARGDLTLRFATNDRTPGVSGAWNVGLDWLHRSADPQNLLVAILDDDDAWEPDYLASCAQLAAERSLDLVATDIIRHEGSARALQPAPDVLRAQDFLTTNPGIQGSNLFARLATLLAAGLFDESLTSCTDRDLCIRIAELGDTRYAALHRPLVHHFADVDRPRLSTPGSPAKLAGLDAFWRKYRRRMTQDERAGFAERAGKLFGWSPPDTPSARLAPQQPRDEGAARGPNLTLVVGVIVTADAALEITPLLDSLSTLRRDPRVTRLDVVLLENGTPRADQGPAEGVEAAAAHARERGLHAVAIPTERQVRDAAAGLFGTRFVRERGRASIALARTMIQAYLYRHTRGLPGAVAWVLDEDSRLESLVWRGGERTERATLDYIGTILQLRAAGVDVALGTCTGAPPLPFASCVRTQLVDAAHAFALLAALPQCGSYPSLLEECMALRAQYADYYYDLSRRETDHLEVPFGYVPERPGTAGEVLVEMIDRLPRILAGEQVFRPLVHDASVDPLHHLQPSVHRGGNTLVFDLEALWEFPNGVPAIGTSTTRRSDMVWSLLNRYVAKRRVERVKLPVHQDRDKLAPGRLDLDKLVQDIQGYALYSALDDLLARRAERKKCEDGALDDTDVAFACERVQKYLRERAAAFQLAFRRAAGLARALERYAADDGPLWWSRGSSGDTFAAARVRLRATLTLFRSEYDLSRLASFQKCVMAVDDANVRDWLETLRRDIDARRAPVRTPDDALAERATPRWSQVSSGPGVRLLGAGQEGVVYTDGRRVYKRFREHRLDASGGRQLRELARRWRGNVRALYDLEVEVDGSAVIAVYPYEPSTPYEGGHGDELRLLLDECARAGITLTNIHPDNLIVTSSGLRFVDYGSDIAPHSPEGFARMARRAWLSGRHHARADLRELLRRSTFDASLPELQGLATFLATSPTSTKEELLDRRVRELLVQAGARRVADYGCGTGGLTQSLALCDATGYDPDPRVSEDAARRHPRLRVVDRATLLRDEARYDAVVCNLVLCVVEGDRAAAQVLRDLAFLSSPRGEVIVTVCNPAAVGRGTLLQAREPCATPELRCVTCKALRASGVRRRDVHLPRRALVQALHASGLHLVSEEETLSFDPDTLDPSSDFLILRLARQPRGAA